MATSRIAVIILVSVLIAQTCPADTDVPSLSLSEAFIAYQGPEPATLLVVPDGTGRPFTQARDENGFEVDATITLYLRDSQGIPFVGYPREDLWLEADGGGLVSCTWGVIADDHTDHNGMTWWTVPALAGGYSEGPVRVFVSDSPLTSNSGLPLRFNSPDINGDLEVNLLDVAIFAGDYFGDYHFRSDFYGGGTLNLADFLYLAASIGARCP